MNMERSNYKALQLTMNLPDKVDTKSGDPMVALLLAPIELNRYILKSVDTGLPGN